MKKYHRKKAGFTLIELLVTMAVLLILISVGVSSYSGLFSQQELLQRTERLYHFLRLAQSQSIKLNKNVYVHFCQLDDTGVWKMAMAEQTSCDCFSASSCLLDSQEVVEDLADGKTLIIPAADLPFTDKSVTFKPIPHSADNGSVVLSDANGNQLKVIQSIMRLRICSPDQDQLGYKKCQ